VKEDFSIKKNKRKKMRVDIKGRKLNYLANDEERN
jgi:hypothetical protein